MVSHGGRETCLVACITYGLKGALCGLAIGGILGLAGEDGNDAALVVDERPWGAAIWVNGRSKFKSSISAHAIPFQHVKPKTQEICEGAANPTAVLFFGVFGFPSICAQRRRQSG